MTDTVEAPVTDSPVRTRLMAAAAGRKTTGRQTVRKATPAKKAAPSRNAKAAARGRYADRIAPLIKLGVTTVFRDPVTARAAVLQVDPWCASLDALAAEDQRVDKLLSRVSGWLGAGGAWGNFTTESARFGAVVLVASGRTPAGPVGMVMSMFAGQMVEIATTDAARQMAEAEAIAAGYIDDGGFPITDPLRVEQLRGELVAAREQKQADHAARTAAAVVDVDQDDDPEPEPPRSPFAAWGR